MSLDNLAKKLNSGLDRDLLVIDMRELMVKHHGKPGIRSALRAETEELLRRRYPYELGG